MYKVLNEYIMAKRQELVASLQEIIGIESVGGQPEENAPYGKGVKDVLLHVLGLSSSLGLKTVNLDNVLGYAELGTGKEMIAALGHLDVVPAGEGWTYPPFASCLVNGKIYGRGAIDNKGPTIAALYALKALKDLELSLKRRVRVIFGTNEETQSSDMDYYTGIEEIPVAGFTPDGKYPVIYAEKGIASFVFSLSIKNNGPVKLLSLQAGSASNIVPDLASAVISAGGQVDKRLCKWSADPRFVIEKTERGQILITARGKSAHSSSPEKGENAIAALAEILSELNFSAEVKGLFRFIDVKIGKETDGKSLGIWCKDEISGQLTLNLALLSYQDGLISFTVDIRYPVKCQYEKFASILTEAIGKTGAKVEGVKHRNPLYMPRENPLIQKLQKVYAAQTGLPPDLLAIGGGTYAKSLPNTVAFGPIFPGERDLCHQPDEYISVENLVKNAQIIAAALYELAN